jgi:release factor glutamine methyltransferase
LQPQAEDAASDELLNAGELLSWRRQMLALGGCTSGFDWLLEMAGGLGWTDLQALRLHPERPVTLRQSRNLLERIWRRHLTFAEPLQYLVGVCPWRDLELMVGPGVLIPRQETELLVELVLQLIPEQDRSEPLLWADLGTGSACLAIALARALPRSAGVAADLSGEALAIAASNIDKAALGSRIDLVLSDWWDGLMHWWGRFSLVVANPPYIPSAVVDGLHPLVRLHEPRMALDGGFDGLDAIRRVVVGATGALAPGGVVLLEHHHDQSDAVCRLMAAAGLSSVRAHADLEGVLRFASARAPGTLAPFKMDSFLPS